MKTTRNYFWTTCTALAFSLAAATAVQAQALKLRLSVESTPGASTQHMLASFRDALLGGRVALDLGVCRDAGRLLPEA